jgi:predicted RNA methylase
MVGAGTGNDAAGGLRNGAEKITAVEIDPGIIEIGKSYHPEAPYSSPHVEIVNDDARSFFATTKEKFDIIIFGLLDSHTTTAMTNARLDHYVYTIESITQAKSLLKDGGILVLTFEAEKPYIADRMANLLNQVFSEKPIVFRIPYSSYGWGGVMFVAGDLEIVSQQLEANQALGEYIEQLKSGFPISLPGTTTITTDDWPYIYLESPRIPQLYYLLIILMSLIFGVSYKKWEGSGLLSQWDRTNWHFFFLGAAFLLLEVQNISKASVVLGNTWEVNAVIISGILFMALLANWLAYQFPNIPVKFAYFILIGICLGLYFLDLAQFAFLPYFYKAIIVGSLTSLPMLFSGFVFIRSFQAVEGKNRALGANLFGALVGALLQSITFIIGIKALLLVVAAFYLLSFITLPEKTD